jgi:cytochrome c
MRLNKLAIIFVCALFFAFSPAHAAGTRDQAKALAEKAAVLVKQNPQKAFAAFQDKNGGFIDGDLYVFVLDSTGKFVAHGAKPALVGTNAKEMRDVTGYPFVQAMLDVKDTGWVSYEWPDPATNNKIGDKASYMIRVGDYIVGVGYYK